MTRIAIFAAGYLLGHRLGWSHGLSRGISDTRRLFIARGTFVVPDFPVEPDYEPGGPLGY